MYKYIYISNHQATQVEVLSMKNGALKVIKNKLKHDFQQKREKGKNSYEVCSHDSKASGDKLLLQVASGISI